MTTRPRVFIVQDDGRRDFTDAVRFGRLIPLVNRDVFVDDTAQRVPAIQAIMRKKLASFNPLQDYLLLTGDPVAIAVAVFTIATLTDTIRVLKWDRDLKAYFAVAIKERGEHGRSHDAQSASA